MANLYDCIAQIALNKNENSAFYWSDMIPSSETYTKTVYTYSLISTNTFDTVNTYDFSTSNYQGLLVYLNNNLLTMGTDYTVGTATVTLTGTLAIGDTIELREYNSTYGNFVPNTPSKMGLYPKYRPQIFVDTSYTTPTTVIQGHDGSITVAFGDFRDQLLLEFETRIYNNIKTDGLVPISLEDVMPGQFRDTDYSLDEINQTLLPMFIDWIGWNKLEYTNQYYDSQNSFTYNYKGSSNALTREPLLGNWRANYLYFYDTITPHLTPWEMLGLSEKPSWWEMEYGPAGFQPQGAKPRNRVGHRAARSLPPRLHAVIKQLATRLLDQLHHPFLNAHLGQIAIIGLGDHINDGIADADNLIGFHWVLSSNWHKSRIRQAPHLGLRATQV